MVLRRDGGLGERDVELLRNVLEQRRRRCIETIERLRREPPEERVEDETTVPVARAGDRERAEYAELARVNEALRRMIDGAYGACEDCGRPIGRERLEVQPTARLCLDCQEREEAR